MNTHNALIRSTHLGFEDHGVFTFMLSLAWDGGVQGFGGWGMRGEFGPAVIMKILQAVGVERWEELKGKHCRFKRDGGGWDAKITEIGHIVEDRWVNPETIAQELGLRGGVDGMARPA